MGENQEAEVQTEEKTQESTGACVGKAINNFMGSLEAALAGRGNAVMVRVNDEALARLDMLVCVEKQSGEAKAWNRHWRF